MRILIIHNSYQQPGGEDAAVKQEFDLLTRKGHDVDLWQVSNDNIVSLRDRLRAASQLAWNERARLATRERIERFKPDIVQVHNFFPLLSPSIYDACRDSSVPVVQTLHNFRIICSSGLLLRNQRVCEDCLHGSPYQAVLHRCYRGSTLGSLAVAHMISKHRAQDTWQTKVDLFFALTDFSKSKFIEAGLPSERIAIKPNFAPEPDQISAGPRSGALYVGRLSEEKGLRVLIDAWRNASVPLRVVGDGPLRETAERMAPPGVEFLGRLDRAAVTAEMQRASFLVVPSTCYEGFPIVIAEAYACGLPMVASRIGGLGEIVDDGKTGRLVDPGCSIGLASVVKQIADSPDALANWRRSARAKYEENYSSDAVYETMMKAYRHILGTKPDAHSSEFTFSASSR